MQGVQDGWAVVEDVAAARRMRPDAGDAAVAQAGGPGGVGAEAWLEARRGLPGALEAGVVAALQEWHQHCWGCAWGAAAAALHR